MLSVSAIQKNRLDHIRRVCGGSAVDAQTCLVFSGLEAHVVTKLKHARERIMEDGNAFLVQGKIEDNHVVMTVLIEMLWPSPRVSKMAGPGSRGALRRG